MSRTAPMPAAPARIPLARANEIAAVHCGRAALRRHDGFGHMALLEPGREAIVEDVLDWLDDRVPAS